jgi:hypothetical protein
MVSIVTGKTVSFRIYVGNAFSSHDTATKEHLTPLENSVLQLAEGLYSVRDKTEYAKTRDRVCRNTNESTNSRVLWFNLMETAVRTFTSCFLHRCFLPINSCYLSCHIGIGYFISWSNRIPSTIH